MPDYKQIKWDEKSNLILNDYKHTYPEYYVKATIRTDKSINILFTPGNEIGSYFSYDVAVRIWSGNRDNRNNAIIYGRSRWSWSITNKNNLSININDFKSSELPIYIEPLCQGCSNGGDCIPFSEPGSTSYIYEVIKSHTHINKPSVPRVIKTTAKTATLAAIESNCEIGIKIGNKYEWKTDNSNGSGIIFNKSSQDIQDEFKVRKKCSCSSYYESDSIKLNYWNIYSTTPTNQGTYHKLKFIGNNIVGTNGKATTKIEYKLYKVVNNIETLKEIKSGMSGTVITFENLDPASYYRCKMNTIGIEDNTTIAGRYTAKPFTAIDEITNISLGSINLNINVKKNETKNLTCKIYIAEVGDESNKQLIRSINIDSDINTSVLIDDDDLITTTEEKNYKIILIYSGTSINGTDDSENITITNNHIFTSLSRNTRNIYIIKNASSKALRTNIDLTLTDLSEEMPTNKLEYYYCLKLANEEPPINLNEYTKTTANVTSSLIYGNTVLRYYLDSDIIINNLFQDTSYKIYGKLVYTESQSNIQTFSGVTEFKTKKMDININNININKKNVNIKYNPLISNASTKKDAITNELFQMIDPVLYMVPISNQTIPNNYEEVIINGQTLYKYIGTKFSKRNYTSVEYMELIYTDLLLGQNYRIDIGYSDGKNEFKHTLLFKTDDEACIYVFYNGNWKKCVPYIFYNGNWKKCGG